MPEAIIIGAAIADIPLFGLSADPFQAHSTPLERIAMQAGGDAANEALMLARLGHPPALISVLGQDAPGDFVLDTLRRGGVDTSLVAREEGLDTGINIVLVRDDGERSFITSRSGSLRRLSAEHIWPALRSPALSGAKIACLASFFVSPMLPGAQIAALFDALKAKGLLLCADSTHPKNGETLADVAPALARLDYFFPNAEEAALLTGTEDPDAAADALLLCGVGHVALKLGAKGCLLASPEQRHWIPAVPAERCVDTTGAGDTFAAAFIAALLEGRCFADCGRFACAAASLCVESVGAAGGAWTRAEADARFTLSRA